MIFELESTREFIRITAEYSNAVMVALLPYFSDFAQKLELPVPLPITAAHVVEAGTLPWQGKDGSVGGGGIRIKGGWSFNFAFGCVDSFEGPHSYYGLQEPSKIPKFYGEVKMSKDEAVELARNTIKKLGIPLEAVFAEQEPRVTLPFKIGTNTVPHYRIEWLDPRGGGHVVDMDIDGRSKTVQHAYFSNENLRRPSPKVKVMAPLAHKSYPSTNPEYARRLVPIVMQAIDDYGKKLALPIPRPLTTNHVARFAVDDNGGWPHCEIELTNGWRFIYRNSIVNGYYAPDNLFNSDQRPILIKEFVGHWKMSEKEAIQLIRQNLAKLNYPTNLVHMNFAPLISKPKLPGIPRYFFSWEYAPKAKRNQDEVNMQSKVEAEVDADKRELKSLYYDDKAYWNHPPPIDVPLTLRVPAETNSSAKKDSEPKLPTQKSQRPIKVFPSSQK